MSEQREGVRKVSKWVRLAWAKLSRESDKAYFLRVAINCESGPAYAPTWVPKTQAREENGDWYVKEWMLEKMAESIESYWGPKAGYDNVVVQVADGKPKPKPQVEEPDFSEDDIPF